MAVGGLPAPGASDPRLSGLLGGGRWLAMFGPRWLARNGNDTDSNIFTPVQVPLAMLATVSCNSHQFDRIQRTNEL